MILQFSNVDLKTSQTSHKKELWLAEEGDLSCRNGAIYVYFP